MRLKKLSVFILLLALLVSLCNFQVYATETDPVGQNASSLNGCHGFDANVTYLGNGKITDNIGAAMLYEVNSDTLMYTHNPDARMYPSSLVKILTALIAVEKGDLEDVVVASQEVLDSIPYYAASAELKAGEKLTLSDLLYCMMVGSANDAAAVIATHISGSQTQFVQSMNDYAKAIGCVGTNFVNVHGLHDENQYTTARDMGRILATAVKNEAFLKYFTTVHYTVPATELTPEPRELASSNFLMNTDTNQLYQDVRALGGRTGTTEDGLRCLASLSEQGSMRLVCIVMGSESVYDDRGNPDVIGSFKETSALLDAGFNGYQVVQVLYQSQVLKQCRVANGSNDVILGSTASFSTVLPESITSADLSYRFTDTDSFTAPINKGQVLSSVQVWYGSLCVGETELIAMNSVHLVDNSQQQASGENNSNNSTAVIIILSIIVVAIGVFFVVRFRKKRQTSLLKRRNKPLKTGRKRSQ